MKPDLPKSQLLGTGITTSSRKKILEYIFRGLRKKAKKMIIFTPNPEIIIMGYHNLQFRTILNTASLALPDGIGVIWAGKLLGKNFKKRITGVDAIFDLCGMASDYGFTVGLIGGEDKIAEIAAECLVRKYPKLKISFAESGGQISEKGEMIGSYQVSKTDLLFVAFGPPKQEIWISENIESLPIKIVMGVGGAFDYIASSVPRAPKWLQNLGFEWLFRLVTQPWRFKRQLALAEFVYLVLKEKFGYHNNNG